MKTIHIFKTGTHTSAAGTTHDFGEDALQAAINAYNPDLHEAPIVIGHPKSNGPAYGWIKTIEFSDGDVTAMPHQVNVEFEEMVKDGAFKKVSASWYTPDHPQNPVPGSLYLRHVGFLGAQPPAIKGLRGIDFNESDGDLIEFEETIDDAIALEGVGGVFKRLREFLIDKFSRDEADRVIPDYVIEDVNNAAKRKFEPQQSINYSEGDTMTLDELKAQNEALQAQIDAATEENGQLKGKVANFEEQQATARKAEIETKVDALVAEGKLPAGQRGKAIHFAESLDGTDTTIEFGEGDDKTELSGADAYLKFLEENTKCAVDFGEHSSDDDEAQKPMTAQELNAKAIEYQEAQAEQGNHITIYQAVNHINNQAE